MLGCKSYVQGCKSCVQGCKSCAHIKKTWEELKTRAEKTGRNISQNTAVIIPAHNIPAFKPSKTFVKSVKQNVPVS